MRNVVAIMGLQVKDFVNGPNCRPVKYELCKSDGNG